MRSIDKNTIKLNKVKTELALVHKIIWRLKVIYAQGIIILNRNTEFFGYIKSGYYF